MVLVREAVQLLLFIILFLAPMLDGTFPVFTNADELAAIVLVVWGIFRKDKIAFNYKERVGLYAMPILLVIGLTSNYITGYQQNTVAIAVDAFTCFKIFAAYYGALQVVHDEEKIFDLLVVAAKALLFCALVGFLLHLSGIVSMGHDRSFMGLPCYQFLFGHPTEFAAYCVGIAALLMVDSRKNKIWILLAVVFLCFTMRAKAAGIAFVIGFFLLRSLVVDGNKKPSALIYLILVIGILFLGADQIEFYFGDSRSARYLLQSTAVQIAQAQFPLGSGFGTFASNMSAVYYSPLYYIYGLSTVYGLMPQAHSYVSDSFWPILIGQFGFIGFIIFLALLASFLLSFIGRAKARRIPVGVYAVIPLYLLILSTADSSFFNFYGPYYALIMAVIALAARPGAIGR